MAKVAQASLRAMTIAAAGVLGGLIAAADVQAGQPWNCLCAGKPRRFIASTHIYEHDLYRGKDVKVAEGFKLLVRPCTTAQFRRWQAGACRKQGCRPPQ
ncbi:MAG: hypothetical protein AB7O57_08725 [Hyphomicrobiaceae bacterium]